MRTAEIKSIGKEWTPVLGAALLSLFQPGAGQLWQGRWRRALLHFVGVRLFDSLALVIMGSIYMQVSAGITGFLVFWAIALGLTLYSIVDAARRARRPREITGRPFQRWYVVAGVVALGIGIQVGAALLAGASLMIFRFEGDWMRPTLEDGDIVIANRLGFRRHPLLRGNAAIFSGTSMPDELYLRRVIGLPGDVIRMKQGRPIINDVPVGQDIIGTEQNEYRGHMVTSVLIKEIMPDGLSYMTLDLFPGGYSHAAGFHRGQGDVFWTLSDNRDLVMDSRELEISFVPVENLVARPLFVLWSSDWSRIGKGIW